MIKVLSYLLLFLGIWILFFKSDIIEYGPGVFAPDTPKQEKISSPKPFILNGEKVTPLAHFELTAKVLSKENYSRDRGAKHSPMDLALGWGRMSDESVINQLEIWQSGRWYRWKTEKFPIPKREIETYSANMHMIPSSETISSTLEKVKEGDLIHLKGKLVRIDSEDGGYWQSSLSREDTGNGACELIYLQSFEILNPLLD